MVIEYAGIVIRSVLTDKREKYYDSKVGRVSGFLISFLVIHFQKGCITFLFTFAGNWLLHVPYR